MTTPQPNRWRSGSVALEFAVLVLPFVAMVFGLIEYARLQWTRGALQEVAIASARCAGLQAASCTAAAGSGGGGRSYSDTQTRAFITAQAAGWYIGLTDANIALTNSAATTCEGAANFVKVSLTYNFSSAFLATIGSATYPITAAACFPNQS